MDRKYQWSRFVGANRDEQVVVRCDNWDEFLDAMDNIENEFFVAPAPIKPIVDTRTIQAPNKTAIPIPVSEFEKKCQRCGAQMVTNPKTGKIFCKEKCWLREDK